MKVGVFTFITALLFALPAWAGTGPDCGTTDTDSDGIYINCDNCDVIANNDQLDGDSDGFGDKCDCDHNNNLLCDGPDFGIFGGWWGSPAPPAPSYVDQNGNGLVDGPDFGLFGAGWGAPPGTSCGNAPGVPCPHVP